MSTRPDGGETDEHDLVLEYRGIDLGFSSESSWISDWIRCRTS